jgi:diguanylate cyclase (GGDEF)-like protein
MSPLHLSPSGHAGSASDAGQAPTDTDRLTGLLNAQVFRSQLELAAAQEGTPVGFALLLVSLDGFRSFNALYGRAQGDRALAAVARRLRAAVGTRGRVARLRADEFAVIFCTQDNSAQCFAGQLLAAVTRPLMQGTEQVLLSASAGLSCYPRDGLSGDAISHAAEIALHHAKRHGGGALACYDEQMGREARRRLELDRALPWALPRGEFVLEYQPRVDLATMEVVAMEALLRWHHPALGRIAPLDFIPLAEESGQIAAIGRWVLHSACRFAQELAEHRARPLRVSVNLSVRQLCDNQVVWDVAEALASSGLPPQLLELELTESLLVEDRERCADILHRLKELGVGLSVDDFGTGYSALAYLQLFPVDAIKLDKSFVNCDGSGRDKLRLVKALVELAHALELTVVAEGVEETDTLRFLQACGCDEIQGYLVAPPLDPAALAGYLDAYVPCLEWLAARSGVLEAAA